MRNSAANTLHNSMVFNEKTKPLQIATQRPSTTGGPASRGARRAIITVHPKNSSVKHTNSSPSQNPGSTLGSGTNQDLKADVKGAPLTIVFDSIQTIGGSQSIE